MLDPEVEARPWDEQVPELGAVGGLAEIGQLPLTEKHELRETVTPEAA